MGQILDVVPNHMGIAGNENQWWNDVLENGPSSPYAGFFDIEWHSSARRELHDRILLPILGAPYGEALESGQIRLGYENGAFSLHYYDHRFPVAPRTYEQILGHRVEELEQTLGADSPDLMEFQSILTAIRHLPGPAETDPAKVAERQREKEVIKRRLAALEEKSAAVRDFIGHNVGAFNGRPGDRHSFDLLDWLLAAQPYRLSYWRVASDEINYRRFFDVNELAALSMERPEVFEATHTLVLRLLESGKVQGLRIDHPDGLYDPRRYLVQLQRQFFLACARALVEARPEAYGGDGRELEERLLARLADPPAELRGTELARPLYVVVEKILTRDEKLPDDWPVHGTSGYEFLNAVNALFVDGGNANAFTRIYGAWIGETVPFAEIAYQEKFLILQVSMSSELHVLARQLDRLAQKNRGSRDFTLNSLRHALREVIALFPVYRSYISDEGVRPADRGYVRTAVARARRRNPAISASIFEFVQAMLLLQYPESANEADRHEQCRFVGKFRQVTAPVMAKGVEDTAFYVYNRLLSLNEVGGDPDRFGLSPAAVHRILQERRERWPWALSATSTHDTKRSEDVRARLNVLSELPDEWLDGLTRWSRLNEAYATVQEDGRVPDRNAEYFLYQTLLGAWPLDPVSAEEYAEFVERIQAYVQKAMHEAKVHTSWVNPDPDFDKAIARYVAGVLDPANTAFLADFRPFQRRVSDYGLFNSLSQAVLKIAAPGVPDVYQGTELWDFSLVDPDNRRPVDLGRRRRLLGELRRRTAAAGSEPAALARTLVAERMDGRVKLYVTHRALACRRDRPGLFTEGEYLPAEATGPGREHVFAFARRRERALALAAVPRLLTRLAPDPAGLPPEPAVWGDTEIRVPGLPPGARLRDVFTGVALVAADRAGQGAFAVGDLFDHFPVALLVSEE